MLGWWERLRGRDDATAVALVRRRLAGLAGLPGRPIPDATSDDDVPSGAVPDPRAVDVPATAPGRTWDRSAARLTVVLLAAGALLGGWWWWGAREQVGSAQPPVVVAAGTPLAAVAASAAAGSPTTAASSAAGVVVVHVVGTVRRPGVLRLPAGSRVTDAVAAAGGLRPGAQAGPVNLARLLVDGEQVVIGPGAMPGVVAAASAGATPGAAGSGPGAPLDLNAATLADLDALPGVGPVLAQRILDFRAERGRFTSVDELREVSGIGEKTFADLSPRVRV